ncbi:MAG: hypothetical protein ABSG43_24970 [Solirubrobacteraceae bacterium]
MAEQPPLDAAQLLGALSRHDVDCVLIGGVAVQAYGHVRTTQDLDVIAAWTPENMQRLARALAELDARLRGIDAELLGIDLTNPRELYDGGNFLMRTRHGDLDVFAVDQTAGAPRSYEQLRARAVAVEVLGARIMVAHPEDLIRMKTAASQFRDRPEPKRRQDLDDIAVLERLRGAEHRRQSTADARGKVIEAPEEQIARERSERETRRLKALREQSRAKQQPPSPPPAGPQRPSAPQPPTQRRRGPTIGP